MKKLNLLIGLLIGITILSCSSDEQTEEQTIRLLKRVTNNSNNRSTQRTFFYKNNNQIDSIQVTGDIDEYTEKYFYNGDILERMEFHPRYFNNNGVSTENYVYNNGVLIERQSGNLRFVYSYESNKINQIQSNPDSNFSKIYTYQYDSNNNITSKKTHFLETGQSHNDWEELFTFDNVKSPYINFEPKIILYNNDYYFNNSNNNPTSVQYRNIVNDNIYFEENYEYIYDNEGYPISRTGGIQTITYEYY